MMRRSDKLGILNLIYEVTILDVEPKDMPIGSHSSSILFVCAGNTCRSPMAEVIAKSLAAGKTLRIESAGTDAVPGSPATAEAIQTMKQMDIDLLGHRARHVSQVRLDDFDVIVALSPRVASQLCQLAPHADSRIIVWDVDDPFGKGQAAYHATARQIKDLVVELVGNER